MAIGTGNGKILLFGEHAAVYGYPAVGATLSLATRAEFKRGGGEIVLHGVPDQHQSGVIRLIYAVGKALGLDDPKAAGAYTIQSDIPFGSGLGSSAALSAALSLALSSEWNLNLPPQRLWLAANEGEKLFHGTPSGIDTGLAIRSGIFSFEGSGDVLPVSLPLPPIQAAIMVAAAPRTGSTATLVGALRERMLNHDPVVSRAMETLGDFARAAISMFKSGDRTAAELGGLATAAHEVLAGLGLSTPDIDDFLQAGSPTGALGGKISGAGGGGACFLIYPDVKTATDAQTAVQTYLPNKNATLSILTIRSLAH